MERRASPLLSGLLVLIGLTGTGVILLFTVAYAFIAAHMGFGVPSKGVDGLTMVMLLGSTIPTICYVLAVAKSWSRKLLLRIGVPIHLPWLPVFMNAGEEIQYFVVASAMATAIVIYVLYVRSVRPDGPIK